MDDSRDGFEERLRKARERSRKVQGKDDEKPKPKKRYGFVPYSTMFKFECRPRPSIAIDVKPRSLQCVNCGDLLEWRIYTIAPTKFDEECPMCHVKACDFWKGKLHKELDSDA